jgi:CSLREA domain-containing protein
MPRGRSALVAAIVLLVCLPASASADTYTVTRTDDPAPDACLPADCSLREAVAAANVTTAVDDLILIPASAARYEVDFESKPVEIGDEVEIRGAGANQTVIEGVKGEAVFDNGTLGTTLVGLTITDGGGIQNNGYLTLIRSSVENNEREGAGAGIQSNGPLTLESSFLGFNRTAGISGGGIQANDDVTIINSSIVGNSSKGNGGIHGNDVVTIVNSAVVGNRSGDLSAGVNGFPLSVKDSVFADNRTPAELFNCSSFTGVSSFGGNVEDGASCAIGPGDRPNVDPLLGPLGLHGGTTPVYELLPASPAIDFASACPPIDQRGTARPQGAACDSGPYEFVPSPPAGDHELAMTVGRGKLPLSKKNRVRVRLTCPTSEASPPCMGKVVLGIVVPPRTSGNGVHALIARRVSFKKSFSLDASKTRGIPVRLSKRAAELLRHSRKARKVLLKVFAEDAAHNVQRIQQLRKIAPR